MYCYICMCLNTPNDSNNRKMQKIIIHKRIKTKGCGLHRKTGKTIPEKMLPYFFN